MRRKERRDGRRQVRAGAGARRERGNTRKERPRWCNVALRERRESEEKMKMRRERGEYKFEARCAM